MSNPTFYYIFVPMKMWAFLFFILPFLGCFYSGWHIWRILPLANGYKALVLAVLLSCFLLMFVNFIVGLERVPLPLARVMYDIGFSSVFVLLYIVIFFLVLDLGKLVHLVPGSFLKNSVVGTITVAGLLIIIFIYGRVHYYNKVLQPLEMTTNKDLKNPMKIVLMSDIHLGYHNSKADLSKWVDMINAENPDLVLIAGDIVDISVHPILEENMAEEFRRLKAPVYTCLGNHDYYAGEPKSEQFYRDSGIRLLRDSHVAFDSGLVVVGRDDRTNPHRKNLRLLMKEVRDSLVADSIQNPYIILLDHQPYNLEQAQQNKVDIQFSGHTHYGQVWPISWIEDRIYEDAFGPLQKGDTFYYVSSGIGIWGGKFRIGTRSEYVVLTISPSKLTEE